VACPKLNLVHDPLPRINWEELVKSGEPTTAEIVEAIRASRLASRALQYNTPLHQELVKDPFTDTPHRYTPGYMGCYPLEGLGNRCPRYKDNNYDPFSSNTACYAGGNPPNPYGDLWAENQNDRNDNGERGGSRLEGDPPEFFEGDRGKTMEFLVTFKRFMIMN
jgi:hypothetical protein